jgi:hypothetical protein
MNGPGLATPTANLVLALVRALIKEHQIDSARQVVADVREACDTLTGEINKIARSAKREKDLTNPDQNDGWF